MIAPSNNPITLLFGATTDPYTPSNPHRGVDFGYSPDSTIYMPCDAVITQKPDNGADGNGTYFHSPDGRYYLGLLHADHYLVPNGATVKQGQPVAIMGDTGFAQGKHLHFAVIDLQKTPDPIMGQYIDPLTILSGGSGGEDMSDLADNYFVQACAEAMLGRTAAGDQNLLNNVGRPKTEVLDTFRSYPEAKLRAQKADNYDKDVATGYAPYNGSPLFTKINGK